jgi:membrane fusion protein, multidrug efflux system
MGFNTNGRRLASRGAVGVWGVLAVSLALVALSACTKPEPAPEPIRAVKVLTVRTEAVGTLHEYAAEIRPRTESRLGFRVAGKILRRSVEVGEHVKAGQVLAQLDSNDYKLADNAARAQVAAAQVNRDLAAADYKRYKDLRDQNFISGAELDRRDATLKAAQAQVEQAQAQQAAQGNQAGYANLVADVAGVVTAIEAEVGQVVAAGTPVVRVAADGARDVVFAVPEDRVAGIKPGALVDVRGWANAARLTGRVREVAASADVQTRTFLVKVSLDARVEGRVDGKAGGAAVPPMGSTVYATPRVAGKEDGAAAGGLAVIKLPTSALRQDGATTAVWVLDAVSMTVRSQVIQIATADGNEAVIVAGLMPGDVVVSAGVHVLAPGQKVRLYADKYPVSDSAVSAISVSKSAIQKNEK